MAAAQSNLKRVSLELGGKSPLIIFADCDVEEAAQWAHTAIMGNHGQNCSAASRTYVEEPIYDQFVQICKTMAENRFVGDPYDALTMQGPLINETQMKKILSYVESGKKEGAKLQCGGERVGDTGYFIQPTVFSEVTDDMSIATDEIFGPVQCILKFTTIEEAIKRANDTKYGLAAGSYHKGYRQGPHCSTECPGRQCVG
ncbi:hypothetical protein ScPMuIL_018951 [Solemya velum]